MSNDWASLFSKKTPEQKPQEQVVQTPAQTQAPPVTEQKSEPPKAEPVTQPVTQTPVTPQPQEPKPQETKSEAPSQPSAFGNLGQVAKSETAKTGFEALGQMAAQGAPVKEIAAQSAFSNLAQTTSQINARTGREETIIPKQESVPWEIKPVVAETDVLEIITIVGEKSDGKTWLAMSPSLVGQKVNVIQFDGKAARVWKNYYKQSPLIKVYTGNPYVDSENPHAFMDTALRNFDHILKIIASFKADPPDWIVFDGLEPLSEIMEMKMRERNHLEAFAPIEWSYWKERRMYLRDVFHKAYEVLTQPTIGVKSGIMFTAYGEMETKKMSGGKIIEAKYTPKYVDIVEKETDDVIHTESEPDTRIGKNKYYATMDSSKGTFIGGQKVDVTDKGLVAFPQFAEYFKIKAPSQVSA